MPRDAKNPGELFSELRELVVGYAQQETIAPLAALKRFIAFGLLGALLVALGGVFMIVGVLRLLQAKTGGTFHGNLSFLPYVITLAFTVAVIAACAAVVMRTKSSQMGNRP